MKKILSVLVAIAMCACLCLPAFAADDSLLGGLGDSLGGLSDSFGDFDLEGLKESIGNLSGDFGELGDSDILGSITDTLGGLFGGLGGSAGGSDSSDTSDSTNGLGSIIGALTDFDLTGVLGSFTEGLDFNGLSELFSGLLGSLGEGGISLDGFNFGDFDIGSILGGLGGDGEGGGILGGNDGSGAGLAGIMDKFGSVLESLGLSSDVIEGLLDNDIINFFANLYLGITDPITPDEPTAPSTEPIHNPDMGVNDASAVIVACATISVAAAAAFVCTRKKRA